jgi:hypothetical protein
MPKQSSFPRECIHQLSRTVTDYVRKHRLDSRCLEQPYGSWGGSFSEADRTLLARLIIWIYDEDVKCGFQGYGGYFSAYLTAHRERTMAVSDVSRTALKAHFDTTFEGYPEDQVMDDDDNAVELEFLWALTALWQDINELSTRMEIDDESVRRIEQRFKMLKKVSIVFKFLLTQAKQSRNTPWCFNFQQNLKRLVPVALISMLTMTSSCTTHCKYISSALQSLI